MHMIDKQSEPQVMVSLWGKRAWNMPVGCRGQGGGGGGGGAGVVVCNVKKNNLK